MRPTPALEVALPLLHSGFRQIAEAVAAMESDESGTLTLSTAPTFAARWLVQRLGGFSRENPGIEIRLVATSALVDISRSDIDCAVRLGRGGWPGVEAECLLPQGAFPVCAPEWAARLSRPEDLAAVPVVTDEGTMFLWPEWFAAAGMPMLELAGPRYTDPILALEAALAGQGVMLAWHMVVADSLANGRLVRPFDVTAHNGLAYWFVTTEARRRSRKVRLFRDWLRREMALCVAFSGQASATL